MISVFITYLFIFFRFDLVGVDVVHFDVRKVTPKLGVNLIIHLGEFEYLRIQRTHKLQKSMTIIQHAISFFLKLILYRPIQV